MLYRPLACLVLAFSLSLVGCSKEEAPPAPYAVEEVSWSQISTDLTAGNTTSVEVTKAYIARIEAYDHALNAVILVAPDALEQAAASDKRRAAGPGAGPDGRRAHTSQRQHRRGGHADNGWVLRPYRKFPCPRL